jgi:hypothetical protein
MLRKLEEQQEIVTLLGKHSTMIIAFFFKKKAYKYLND